MARAYRLAPRHPDDKKPVDGYHEPLFIGRKLYRTQPDAEQAAVDLTKVFRTPVDVLEVYNGSKWGRIVYSAGF